MGLKEEINDMKKEVKSVKELNKQSLAKEMLEDIIYNNISNLNNVVCNRLLFSLYS